TKPPYKLLHALPEPCRATAYEQKNTISMVKHGCGTVLLLGCFAIAESGHLGFFEIPGHFADDHWTFQQGNHPKVYMQIFCLKVYKWPDTTRNQRSSCITTLFQNSLTQIFRCVQHFL
uniref:Uncharacterized protein n=1 Tax=Cyprinus carpio TaxID=7962 RepID=A0A8C1MCY3_CYPCA